MSRSQFPVCQEFWRGAPHPQEHIRRVAIVVNGLLRGEMNNIGDVTLEANATETDVEDSRITSNTLVFLIP